MSKRVENSRAFCAVFWQKLGLWLVIVTSGIFSAGVSSAETYSPYIGFNPVFGGWSVRASNPELLGPHLDIPETFAGEPVIEIGDYGFSYCTHLKTISIPKSVKKIRVGAFYESGLRSIVVPKTVAVLESQAFAGATKLEKAVLPEGIKVLPNGLFFDCGKLTEVEIPEGVVRVRSEAFRGVGVTKVVLPASLEKLDGLAFVDCKSLTTVVAQSAFSYDGGGTTWSGIYYPFDKCPLLREVVFRGGCPTRLRPVESEDDRGLFGYGNAFPNLKIYFPEGATGFTEPLWSGYPSFPVGADVVVQQPKGSGLVSGLSKKSFGVVPVKGGIIREKVFTLRNDGLRELRNISVSISGKDRSDFRVIQAPRSVLAPGAKTTFKVLFKPKATKTRSAAVEIRSSDPDENPFVVRVTGAGA